ncbi:conserved protein of unknown function [Rhodovastum atsumiense]|uniref:Uncharacterized protein n=1 Tax=Rhodovastum atsumiense TaxID=504468 RepID=A0A5M6IT53_9PROT|nr:hypothetical protein [Rhodovastum atsumiense]KAA5611496.1 hypothetical protein F1189_14305 [Rhodovastum atsumiense]CAH2601192.1 conserved protein of unknown function [Rhodovastum atsumiense]
MPETARIATTDVAHALASFQAALRHWGRTLTVTTTAGNTSLSDTRLAGVRQFVAGGMIVPVLHMTRTIIGRDSTIETFDGIPVAIRNAGGIVRAAGWNINLGTFAATADAASVDGQSHPTMQVQIVDGTRPDGGGPVAGVFVNAGTLRTSAAGRLWIDAQSADARLVNLGRIDAGGSTVLNTEVIGIGEIRLEAPGFLNGLPEGASVTANRAVGPGQVVTFNGGGDLRIADLPAFRALIRGFGTAPGAAHVEQERIDLIGLDVTAISYRGDRRAGVLRLEHDGTRLGELRFAGPYTAASFALSRGEAGTTILARPG